MAKRSLLGSWPVVRQLREGDLRGRGPAVQSTRSKALKPRIDDAEHVVQSVCPYCAVGCGQLVYVKDGEVTHIEGDPASPISRGRLCPKGQASKSYVQGPLREYTVKYRRPYGTRWEELDLDTAMEMIADRVLKAREETWEDTDDAGRPLHRTLGIARPARRTGRRRPRKATPRTARWRSATSAGRRSTTKRTI
jgi:formate dehydrogenase major subunit